ncbi:helix-turn-helix transcriptional regulator, partial [Acinetobacter baumannii]|nr:helix-turn-helix transcriptional regulator [Acinetobacter baumannii]
MVRGIANSKIGFGDLILLLRYFFKLKVSTHPNRYLARFDKENILARVKVKLIEKLSTGDFQQQDVAKSLGLSIRSLQRKLSAENTSYSELLDQTRHELALSYIKNSSHNITEIAYILGFTDVSSFTRAFRRWTDLSPIHYREKYLACS